MELCYDLDVDLGGLSPKIVMDILTFPGPTILYFAYRLIFLYIEHDSRLRKWCIAAVDIL